MNTRFAGVPIFAGLAQPTLHVLWNRAGTCEAAPDELIVREGEPGNKLFIVNTGRVRVLKQGAAEGKHVELAVLAPGDFFGEMCILETLPRSATVCACGPTSLWTLTSLDFYHLYLDRPAEYSILLLNIARDLSRRLRKLDAAFAARHA